MKSITLTKPIIIKETNSERIQKQLDEFQTRYRERTINSEDILEMITKLDDYFYFVAKSRLDGVKANLCFYPTIRVNAYKYSMDATWANVEYKNNSWRLVGLERADVNGKKRNAYLKLTEDAKQAIIESYEAIELY